MTDVGYGYKYETDKSAANFTNRERTVKGITIHHWGSTGQSFDGVVRELCDPGGRDVSAHYVAQGTDANGTVNKRVSCVVDPDKIAWHAGDWQANVDTVGIECRPEARDADYTVVSELVARLWITYGVVPLYPHKHWVATACPGKWDLGRIKTMATAKMAALKAAPAPAPVPAAAITTCVIATDLAVSFRGGAVRIAASVLPATAQGKVRFQWFNGTEWKTIDDISVVNGKATLVNSPMSNVTYRADFVSGDTSKWKNDAAPNVSVRVLQPAEVLKGMSA